MVGTIKRGNRSTPKGDRVRPPVHGINRMSNIQGMLPTEHVPMHFAGMAPPKASGGHVPLAPSARFLGEPMSKPPKPTLKKAPSGRKPKRSGPKPRGPSGPVYK